MSKTILFSKRGCTPCSSVKRFLLSETDLEYTEYDIEKDPDMIVKYDVMSVPVTILLDKDDNEIFRTQGFNPGELQELNDLAKKQ